MIPIVFSTDHNFVMPTGVTICSLLLSADNETYDIYILASPDVTEVDKKNLENQVKTISPESTISFIEMGESFNNSFEVRNISTACYYRMMIPWLIPNVDKIIYCDGDIIVHTPLTELFDIDLKDKYVAGNNSVTGKGWADIKKYLYGIGLDNKEYINSGVLVINSALQRKDNLKVKYEELSKKKFLYQDQDIINIVCKGKIRHFHFKYNLPPYYLGVHKEINNRYILHYAGDKPWRTFTYAWEEWWEVYKKSLFCDMKFYHDVSANIISPIGQLKNYKRKASIKFRIKLSKIFVNKFNF